MEDKKLYILAGYDDATEEQLAGLQKKLYEAGFVGKETKNIPMHITLGSFPTDREEELKAVLEGAVEELAGNPKKLALTPFDTDKETLSRIAFYEATH